MQRIVIDTNVYIDWLNSGRYEELFFAPGAVKHLSSIVMMELLAGAFAPKDRKLLQGITRSFAAVGRLLLPTIAVYQDAGEVLRRLQVVRGYMARGTATLVNDVLIALSARSIGATVITQNKRDYVAIQSIRPFQLRVVT
jgi:predicted nucleic acid-binding protein